MAALPKPTKRELEILKILWDLGEASVRTVFDEMSRTAPIVQNTVQAFLRTMESKGLVRHRVEGRTFIYVPVIKRDQAGKKLMKQALHTVFEGAIDQLVQSAFSVRQPTEDELRRLEEMIRKIRNDN
jgi:predicted transcriptional regulator